MTNPAVDKGNAQNIVVSVIFLLILSSFAFLIVNAFQLTIVREKEYKLLAETNSVGKEAVFGERGLILDRNGAPLVVNVKTYDVYINPSLISENEVLLVLPTFKEKITEAFKNSPVSEILLIHNAPKDTIVQLKEKAIQGISIRHNYVREYPYKNMFSHVLGYTGVASENNHRDDASIIANQIVGKSGLEYQYEKLLRGELRYDTYEKDAFGLPVSNIIQATPSSGKTLTTSVDKRHQNAMYSAIKATVDKNKAKGGSGVIVDITNGEVITMVSYPAYDANEFVGGISQKSYSKLLNNPQTPLLFRPIAAQEPPGSTFKTIVAAAALDTGAINDKTVYTSTGVIKLAGGFPFQDYRKRVYGPLTVRDALMVSSNIFFCRTILALGIDNFIPYAEAFGIGEESGIDLPGEMTGRIPSPENKIALAKTGNYFLDPVWYPEGDACNSAIGQGIALATPLQMANVAAIIANGGVVYKPHLVTKITDSAGKTTEVKPVVLRDSIVNAYNLQIVREGMRLSVYAPRGVISSLKYVPVAVAAKTGTAEFGIKDKNGYSTAHAWVIGFYPYEKPRYAFAVLIEGGGTSSVASLAMRDFLNTIY
jgi:penicillin-binding protein 2